MPVYLDNNATTQPLPEVVEAVERTLRDEWANPSSVHRAGQAARRRVELARESLASLIGATPAEVVFTSGATESIGLAIRGVLLASPASKRTIITTAVEHEAVRDLCKSLVRETGAQVRLLPLREGGVADAEALPGLIDESTAIVSVQWANNETGAIQPVERIAGICRARGVPFHTDATQWVGKMPTDLRAVPVGLLSLSAHKFHGPKGAGALFVRRGVGIRPVIPGVQERERRGGTENVPGIVGMGVAADLARQWLARPEERDRVRTMRDRFEREVIERVEGARVNAGGVERLWNTTNIAFPKLEAEALLMLLSERGVDASAGAACSSGSLDPSPVLLAMGIPDEVAHGSLRFSLSRFTTEAEIDEALRVIPPCVARVRMSATSVVPSDGGRPA